MSDKPLLLIDFQSGGHHASFIRLLVRCATENSQTSLVFLIPKASSDEIRALLSERELAFFIPRVKLLEEDPAWVWLTKHFSSPTIVYGLYFEILNFRERKRSQLRYLFLENVIYQAAFSPLPRFNISGMMFRPTIHYRERGMLGPGSKNRMLFHVKWLMAYLLAKRPGFKRIFVQDPLAEEYAHKHWGAKKFLVVPDPAGMQELTPRPAGDGKSAAVRPLKLLVAGALHPRKGLHFIVNALENSPEEVRKNIQLVVVGRPEKGAEEYVTENLEKLKNMGTEVASDVRFISDEELHQYFEDAHIVMIPYLGFKGSSGILIHAAHFSKPVISTKDGLLGYLVERHQLGAAIDPSDVTLFAGLLEQVVRTGLVPGFDPVAARAFADSCDPEFYARVMLSY
jgi:glycosyltransferase involved in cell wall biosynthesis